MSLPAGLALEVSVDYEPWRDAIADHEKIVVNCAELIIDKIPEGSALDKFSHIELGVVLCDDAFIHTLNKDYRKQDKATNVLSFNGLEQGELDDYLRSEREAPNWPISLGEMYIAFETVNNEAESANISLEDHFVHLVIHGFLHLLGYDHIIDAEAKIMEALETKLLGHLGIDDPYSA